MKQRVGRYIGVAALFAIVGTACASTGDSDVGGGGDDSDAAESPDSSYTGGDSSYGYDAGGGSDNYVPYDSTPPEDTGSASDTGGVCTPTCHTDQDCESTCAPAPQGGVNCCDTSSGVCFANTGSTCPVSGGNDP